jgi:hypothetical protein
MDEQIVSVRLGDAVFEIPRNYLAGVTQPRDSNPYASFTIQVLLPDFSPRTSENTNQFDQVGWHNQLRALFEYPRRPRRPEELLDFYLKLAGKSKQDYQAVGSDYKLYKSATAVPHEMFTKDTANGLLFFTCDVKDTVPSPSCTFNEPFEDEIGVIYHFSREYLDQASEIDMKLHALLKNFSRK